MAISLRTPGTWAYDSSGSITVTLPTHQAGDMLIVRVAIKSGAIATCTASTATSGWAKVGQYAGSTNSGNGTGSVLVAAFWKEAASGAEGNPTIDFSQTNTQGGVVAMAYQKGAEVWATPVGDGGLDEGTANTSHSATIASHVSVTAGDMVDFFTGIRDDCTMTVPTITQAGVTYDTVVESPAAAGSDAAGADGAYDGGYRLATAGTSSAAAVVTGTLDTSEQGTSWMTRLRVGPFTGTGAISVPSATVAGTGAEVFTATGVVTVPAATVDGTGAHAQNATGTGAITVSAPTVVGTGAEVFTATGDVTVPAATAAGAGAEIFTATGAVAVPAATVVGTGVEEFTASGAIAASAATVAGSGALIFTATGAVTAPAATVDGVGAEAFTATGSITVSAPTVVGTRDHSTVAATHTGTGAISVPAVTVAGVGSVTEAGAALPAGRRPGLVRIPWTRLNPEDDEWDDLVAALLD